MSILEIIVLANFVFNFLLFLFMAIKEDLREEEREIEEELERMSWKKERTLYNVDLKKEIKNDKSYIKDSTLHILRQ